MFSDIKYKRKVHESEKGMFMRKKHKKVVALGLAAIMSLTPMCDVAYAMDTDILSERSFASHEITGDLTVGNFASEKTNAVTFCDGDNYKFKFHNKSNGELNWDNFLLEVADTDYRYFIDLRADVYGWSYGYDENSGTSIEDATLDWQSDVDWDLWVSEMQAGVDCEVTVARNGNTISYLATIGKYTVSAEVYMGANFPDDALLCFTGENCELTGFETEYWTTKPEQTDTDASKPDTPEQTDTDAPQAPAEPGKITGDLTVDVFFSKRTSMVALDKNGTYTFKFHNKSNGQNPWDNFVMAIIGVNPDRYSSDMDEVLVVRADPWGWGGGMSDFKAPDYGSGNVLYFHHDMLEEAEFIAEMQKGVDCEVTISRNKDILVYQAKVGSYTIDLTAVSGMTLPETCYLFFTGENCELTGFETEYSSESIKEEILTVQDIPDEYLYARILEASDLNGDGMIQKAEAESLTYLYLWQQVTDYTGIEYLSNLKTLEASYSYDSDADSYFLQMMEKVSQIDTLETLYVPDNAVLDADVAEILYQMSLVNLYRIDIKDSTVLSPEDTTDLPFFDTISTLRIDVRGDVSFAAFAAMKNLYNLSVNVSFDAAASKITDCEALGQLSDLYYLNISGYLGNVEFSGDGFGNVNELYLNNYSDTKVACDIRLLKNVEYVHLDGLALQGSMADLNQDIRRLEIEDCTLPEDAKTIDLSKFTELYSLDFRDLAVTEITGLEHVDGLRYLDIYNLDIDTVPQLSDIAGIHDINICNTNISDILPIVNRSAANELNHLYLYNNAIETLPDLSALTELYTLDLSNNKLETLPDLSALTWLYHLDVSYNKLETLPDLSANKNLIDLHLHNNALTTLEGAGLEQLESLEFNWFSLQGNLLTVDTVTGFVPEKFSADISWLAEATTRYINNDYVYTWLNSELIASDLDEKLGYGYGDIYLYYTTTEESVEIEEELLEYIRELEQNVSLSVYAVNIENGGPEGGIYCDFSNVPEDVTSFTIYPKTVEVVLASKEMQDIFGNSQVYTGFKEGNKNPSYISLRNSSNDYNVYAYDSHGVRRVDRDVSFDIVLRYIQNGVYPEEGYYYIINYNDTYYHYTEEDGKYTDPKRDEYADVNNQTLLDVLENAKEGDSVSATLYSGYSSGMSSHIPSNVWNMIIEKKLTVELININGSKEIGSVFRLSYEDMELIEEKDHIELSLSNYTNGVDGQIGYSFSAMHWIKDKDNEYSWTVYPMYDFTLMADIYVGMSLFNGENGYHVLSQSYILDKDMNKQIVYETDDTVYTAKAGMITTKLQHGQSLDLVTEAEAKKEVEEAEVPEYSEDVVYKNGDVILEASDKKISNLNVKGTGNDLTIVTTFDYDVENYSSTTLFTMDDRKGDDSIKLIADGSGDLVCYLSSSLSSYRNGYCSDVFTESKTYTVTTRLSKNENGGTHLELIVDNVKVYEKDYSSYYFDISKLNTFYNNQGGISEVYTDSSTYPCASNVTSTVYAGAVLPDNVVEKEGLVKETDKITGDYTVTDFFGTKTDAVKLQDGDSYTFTFHNKSTGANNWDNFVCAITSEIGYDYVGYSDEVLILRADAWGWGGGESDFAEPGSDYGIPLVFHHNIDDWDAWNKLMANGADCTVTISKSGKTLTYKATMGDYQIECVATNSWYLPSTCYVFFTGENCILTGFDTAKADIDSPSEEETTTKAEETTTTGKVEETTTTGKVEETTTTGKVEETTTTGKVEEEATTTGKVEETTTTGKVEETTTTSKVEETTTTGKVEETTTTGKVEEEATTTGKVEEETTTKAEVTTTTKPAETTTKAEVTTTTKPEETTTKAEETTTVKKTNATTIKQDKIVEVEKVLDTAIDKMKSSILKTVEVISDAAQTLTKSVFDTLQKEGKNLTVGVTNENNELQYSWTFSNRTLKDTDMNIDLSIKFDTEKKEEIQKLTGRDNAMYVSFAHHGELPGPATIKSFVGDTYRDGEMIYLYYFDEEQNKVLMVGDHALQVKGGYVEYTITHCSTYFFMEEKLEGVEKDARSLDNASMVVTDEKAVLTVNGQEVPTNDTATSEKETTAKDADIPKTGDAATDSRRYLIMMFAFAMVALTTNFVLKKTEKNTK